MNNMKKIASELCSWGKQVLDHLLIKMIDELFLQNFRQFLSRRKNLRQNKSTRKRIIKVLALSLSVVIAIGLFVIAPIIGTSHTNNEATTVISVEQICSADNEEVNTCLPVQQYAENNSVNSTKLCMQKSRTLYCALDFYVYINSLFTTSVALLRILFIQATHSI